MPGIAYDDAVALLQKTRSIDDTSVYDHLTKVVLQILEQQPADAVDLLETSLLAKKAAASGVAGRPTEPNIDTARGKSVAKLFGTAEVPINAETGEPEEVEPPNEYECENIVADAALFDTVGAGLGLKEAYRAMLAAKQLGEDPSKGVATVRFFGKVLGTYADYYVFETTVRSPDETEEPALGAGEVPPEKGTGANGYVYWVCNHLGGTMTRLPDVKPAQIKVARQLKHFLTGKLDAFVSAYPPFPGNEAAFLRAQLARIAATTVLCPVGYFTAGEGGVLEKSEGFTPPPATELALPTGWAHRYPHLKKQGRTLLHLREAEGEEPLEPTEEESEAGPEPLTTLDTDTQVDGGDAWTGVTSSAAAGVKFQVAGVRSCLWPGAVAVAGPSGAFSSVYVGWAIKNAPFVPMPPPPVAKECNQDALESTELPDKPDAEQPPAEAEPAEPDE